MEALNEWTLALCACAAAVSLAEMLLPEGAVKKTAYFVLSLITATCLISPIREINELSIGIETHAEQPYTDWFSRVTEDEFAANIRKILEDTLSSIGVKAEKIYVETDISEDGSVYINKARITIDERYADMIGEIERAAQTAIGAETDVICSAAADGSKNQ